MIHRLRNLGLGCLVVSLVATAAMTAVAQTPQDETDSQPVEAVEEETDLRPLSNSDSLFSLEGGQQLMAEAETAINSQEYDTAIEKLQTARQVFNQLSNFHLQLAESFSGIDNRITEEQRRKALNSGQMRDEATYQLALVHRAQDKPELSVPLLIQIIRSQNPSSELGKKAYQQLLEIGFVDSPYSSTNSSN